MLTGHWIILNSFYWMEPDFFRKSEQGINNLNKDNKALWEFTYRILNEEKERVKVVNSNPDNLLVQWVPGGMTLTELLKASNRGESPEYEGERCL